MQLYLKKRAIFLIEVTFFVMISYIYFGKRRVSGKKILVEGSSQEKSSIKTITLRSVKGAWGFSTEKIGLKRNGFGHQVFFFK